MPLPFALVCDLLDECQRLCLARRPNAHAVTDWFSRHRRRVDAYDSNLSALLSTLLPEKRTDRVYCIQAATLEKVVGRALILGSSRIAELARYKHPGLGLDLADCVERILTVTPNPLFSAQRRVSVEDIDHVLHGLASKIRWSSPAIRSAEATLTLRSRGDLEAIYQRLDAREAKWFTRLILKNYQPLILDSHLVYRCCHPMLPSILKIQDDFAAAIKIVQNAKGKLLPNSARTAPMSRGMLASIQPQLGTKVGRQNWIKARSMKHCVDLGHGRMSVENKVDGEYCQIHADATCNPPRVQIFSKSGKDSTEDRQGLHRHATLAGGRGNIADRCRVIVESLNLGLPGSSVRKGCILEGELVVYSDLESKILPFHRIRSHVARRGRFLNTKEDTPPKPHEKLMIVYFDMLLLDDQSLLGVRHSERFKLLEQTVRRDKGRAELVPRQVIDFGHCLAVSELRKAFAKVIVERGEGLVLKPDELYFNFHRSDHAFAGRCIKLKKEYIGSFGDVGDFAVVGAGFDAARARSYGIPNLQWTHFYVGCLGNREQVKRWSATPEFTVVSVVELNEAQLETVVTHGQPMPVPLAENGVTRLNVPKGIGTNTPLTVAFQNPLVFDLRCFSFDKPGNTGFWTPRFPAVSKIHFDRDYWDTVSFEELQAMARNATTAPELEDSQENLAWIARLEGADPRGLPVDLVSQVTATTMSTPSPIKSTQASTGSRSHATPDAAKSVGQACTSPERTKASVRGAKLFAIPPVPLKIPPGSPKSREPKETPDETPRKRSLPSSAATSTARKRRTSLGTELAWPSLSQNGLRRPLENTDGNASHHAATISSLMEHREPKHQPHDEAASDADAPRSQRGGIVVQAGNAGDGNPTVPSGSEVAGLRETMASSSHPPAEVLGSTVGAAGTEKSGCSYAGAKCHLAGSAILVSSASLTDSLEPATLFEAHGILGTITLADQWLELQRKGGECQRSPSQGQLRILLVDSVDKPSETKALLARIEEARKELPRRKRDWVTVYDWRVLRYLTILEDKGITNKYYDGFHDPWRRWYCGVV